MYKKFEKILQNKIMRIVNEILLKILEKLKNNFLKFLNLEKSC